MSNSKHNAGFTLVELAIVLVIIGLLVGGILVGQDLIKAAEINSTTSQMARYDQAANAFRTKYNGYPGDLRNPANYPIASTAWNTAGTGPNGNNTFEDGACTDANGVGFGGEAALFWTHLSQVNMIPDGVTGVTSYAAPAAITAINDTHMPQARLGNGNRFHIAGIASRNWYILSNMTATAATTCTITSAPALTPLQASQIDTKLDDGLAASGIVNSIASAATATAVGGGTAGSTMAVGRCYATDATGAYANLPIGTYGTAADDTANGLGCQLRIRTSF